MIPDQKPNQNDTEEYQELLWLPSLEDYYPFG
jgi:hypothetical protein